MAASKPALDIEEAVAAVGMGAWQAPVLLLTMLVGFADAVEVMVLSVAGPAINCAWGLSEVEEALKELDLDLLTPIDALLQLRELKSKLERP